MKWLMVIRTTSYNCSHLLVCKANGLKTVSNSFSMADTLNNKLNRGVNTEKNVRN